VEDALHGLDKNGAMPIDQRRQRTDISRCGPVTIVVPFEQIIADVLRDGLLESSLCCFVVFGYAKELRKDRGVNVLANEHIVLEIEARRTDRRSEQTFRLREEVC